MDTEEAIMAVGETEETEEAEEVAEAAVVEEDVVGEEAERGWPCSQQSLHVVLRWRCHGESTAGHVEEMRPFQGAAIGAALGIAKSRMIRAQADRTGRERQAQHRTSVVYS